MAMLAAEGLIGETPKGPRLLGGRRLDTGKIVFPMPSGAEAALHEPVELNPEGRLWSWTVQRFRPKPPFRGGEEPFEPYAVGYVELAGQVIVEARLAVENFADLSIGAPMRLTLIPAWRDEEGREVRTFAFAPIKNGDIAEGEDQ